MADSGHCAAIHLCVPTPSYDCRVATTYPILRWQIGDVRITRVAEMEGPSPGTFLFAEATPEKLLQHAWLKPHFLTDDGRIIASIHAFVIESEGKSIVVDTCVGNDKPRDVGPWNLRKGRFLEDLAEAGFPRERIDTVLCTHLHVDHVGWNTRLERGKWVPTFPNARYLIGRKEWAYWKDGADGGDKVVQTDSVRPIIYAGLADFVDADHKVTSEVWLEPTPGHTPGHVSVRISSNGEDAVITGDLMHHPVQCSEPRWASNFDVDADAARKTRREFLERYRDGKTLVLGTHFATPTGGRVEAQGGAFRFRT
jgi:glyoxylase-like metal-dependent hydrolase (beta-lactamase superfamily II)